jgi:hypothetical protein
LKSLDTTVARNPVGIHIQVGVLVAPIDVIFVIGIFEAFVDGSAFLLSVAGNVNAIEVLLHQKPAFVSRISVLTLVVEHDCVVVISETNAFLLFASCIITCEDVVLECLYLDVRRNQNSVTVQSRVL